MSKLIQAIIDFFKNLFSSNNTDTNLNTKTQSQMDQSKPKQKTLYALMVAIDRYQRPVPPLNGCVNDRDAMKEYLERQFASQQDVQLNIKTMTDTEATKQGIIDAFSHFEKAKKDDICLFYFSGHGSQAPSPREFYHLDPDGMNETLVCYDSRTGAKDLMDKEISYLIWQATHQKEQHFIAIFDCCNSGTITRDATMTVRQTRATPYPTRFQEYFGYQNYKIDQQPGGAFASPPRGRYVQLSACKEQETAKETKIDGKTRGIFTYNLVQALEQSGGNISYAELQQILHIRIGNKVRDQFPQLITTNPGDKNQRFLGGVIPPAAQTYLIQYSKGKWLMNAGSVQGIPAQGGTVELEDGSQVTLTKVMPNQSEVAGMEGRDTNQSYKAVPRALDFPKMKIAYAPNASNDGKRVLNNIAKKYPSAVFEIVKDAEEADYWIRCMDRTFRLTLPDDERPVFRRVEDYSDASAMAFLSHAEKVANWHNLLQLSNPKTSIKDKDIEIELYRITEPGNEEDNAPAERVNWRERTILRYEKGAEGEWKPPAIRMRVRNKSKRPLFFSAMNIMDNFEISNRFMPYQELQPGEDAWLQDVFEGNTYLTIPLSIDDSYHSWGITEAKEYFKLLISTDQYLRTDNYNQEGLELDFNLQDLATKRAGRKSGSTPEEPDWTTRDIELLVVRPMEQRSLRAEETIDVVENVKVTAPRGLSAAIALGTLSEAERSLSSSEQYPELTFTPAAMRSGDISSQPYEFTPGNHNSPGLSVLELYEVQGREAVNADNPLKVRVPGQGSKDEMVIPMGFDPQTGLYYPLGYADESGEIRIESLPDETETGTRSLFGSVKIFFQKVVFNKLGFDYNYPQLAIAKFDETGESFTYDTDVKNIREAVAKAENIALFIHGIIGDTTDMPQMLHRIRAYKGEDSFQNPYDLVLTFDYENLNTEIQQTARGLKKRLAGVGLEANHDKDLTIIAHSMGGLVSRWFIEKEGGNAVVNHLIQVGTPNAGSPWSDVYQLSTALLTQAVNGAAFLQPYILTLNLLGKFAGKMFKTLQQMDPDDSPFLQELNDGTDPGIPYTIVAGNTKLYPLPADLAEAHKNILRRVLERFRHGSGYYGILDDFLFKEPNDIAVSVNSIYGIPNMDRWQTPPRQISTGCDHISYFAHPIGLEALEQAVLRS